MLAVGTLEPRKNLPRLVSAYAQLPRVLQDTHPLVVVGADGWQTGEIVTALDSLGERCIRLGHIPDQALSELYRRCAVFCYPSLGEGFGLPVLEAMAAGAAVVTSSLSSLPEVGGDAVEYVDHYSVQSIATGLQRVLSTPGRRPSLASWRSFGRGGSPGSRPRRECSRRSIPLWPHRYSGATLERFDHVGVVRLSAHRLSDAPFDISPTDRSDSRSTGKHWCADIRACGDP